MSKKKDVYWLEKCNRGEMTVKKESVITQLINTQMEDAGATATECHINKSGRSFDI